MEDSLLMPAGSSWNIIRFLQYISYMLTYVFGGGGGGEGFTGAHTCVHVCVRVHGRVCVHAILSRLRLAFSSNEDKDQLHFTLYLAYMLQKF